MRRFLVFAILGATLTACGVDGPPSAPEPKAETGVTVSGKVSVGVSGTL